MHDLYWAFYLGGYDGLPVVVYPPPEKDAFGGDKFHPVEFHLADEAEVELEDGKRGRWGDLRKTLQIPDYKTGDWKRGAPFAVKVVDSIWRVNPTEVLQHIRELNEKISRRNRQIADLRDKIAAAKKLIVEA